MLRRNKENFSDGNFIEAYFATIFTSTHYQLMWVYVSDDNVAVIKAYMAGCTSTCLKKAGHQTKIFISFNLIIQAVLVTEVQD